MTVHPKCQFKSSAHVSHPVELFKNSPSGHPTKVHEWCPGQGMEPLPVTNEDVAAAIAEDLKLADQKAAMEKSAKVAAEQQALLSGPSGAGSTKAAVGPLNINSEALSKKAPELAVRLDAVDMKGGLILVDTDGVRHPVEGVTDIDLNFTPGELPTVRVEFKLTKGIKFL